MGYLYGKGLDRVSKPEQPSESHGWFGSPHRGGQEVWTHSPDGNSVSLRIEGEDLPPMPSLSDPELESWEPGQRSAPMPAMPRHSGILFTPPETWERVPEEEMTEGRVYGNMQPMPKPGTGRILVYPHIDGEEHMLSAHWEGENVGERGPMRATTVEGYAPAVLMWAYHMPTSETFFIVDEGATWLPLDKALYDKLMKGPVTQKASQRLAAGSWRRPDTGGLPPGWISLLGEVAIGCCRGQRVLERPLSDG